MKLVAALVCLSSLAAAESKELRPVVCTNWDIGSVKGGDGKAREIVLCTSTKPSREANARAFTMSVYKLVALPDGAGNTNQYMVGYR